MTTCKLNKTKIVLMRDQKISNETIKSYQTQLVQPYRFIASPLYFFVNLAVYWAFRDKIFLFKIFTLILKSISCQNLKMFS